MSYETLIADSRDRKRGKYFDLVKSARDAGFSASITTIEVGSRGMLGEESLAELKKAIPAPSKVYNKLAI